MDTPQQATAPSVMSSSHSRAPLPDIGTLIRSSLALFMEKKKLAFEIAGVSAIVGLITALLFIAGTSQPVLLVIGVLSGIISALIAFVTTIALYQAYNGTATTTRAAYLAALPLIVPFAWVQILQSTAIVGGIMLLIVPGIIIAIWLTLIAPIVIIENRRGLAALARSKAYVRGLWWPVAGRILLGGFVITIISSTLSGIFVSIASSAGMDIKSAEGYMIQSIIQTIISVVIGPLWIAYALTLYRQLVALHAGESIDDPKDASVLRTFSIIGLVAAVLLLIGGVIGFASLFHQIAPTSGLPSFPKVR